MAENGAGSGGGGAGGGDGMAAAAGAGKPPRPTIMLPPRSSMASLFHEGGGGASEVSPGPLTLVSSFFADDPETECRSFTQLLVGAMNSPVAAARRPAGISWEQEKVAAGGSEDGGAEGGGIGGDGGVSRLNRVKQNRPASLTVSQPQAFTIAPGLSPSSLLDSPGFFSSGLGTFVMSHQEALAQVTAQASQSQFKMLSQAEYPSEFVTTPPSSQQLIQETPTRKRNNSVFESAEGSLSDQISHPTAIVVDKPASDGYNWRKYGQKMVRSSEYPRSYYKCSHPNCPVKKKVEHSADGQITEIIYKGQHNHQRPTPNKRFKEGDSFLSGSNEITESLDNPSTPESGFHGNHGNLRRSNGMTAATSASKRDREFDYGAPEQLSGSTDREEASETQTDGRDNHDADAKRMNVSASSQTTSAEPKIVVQTTSEVDLLDDGYRWRKYGQKVVKGNPNPRSYYKCTYLGCNVRKHVERAPTDPKSVITTYEGKHNHDVPTSRNSSRNLACAGVASSIVQSNSQPSLRTTNFRNNDQQPVAVLQLKEEREIT